MLVEEGVVDSVESGQFDGLPSESEDDEEYPLGLQGECVGVDGLVDSVPLDDLDERVDEQAQLLEEGVPELDSLVEELDVLAELAGQQLRVHLPLERRVPRLAHVLHPLLADSPHAEQLRCRQIGKDVVHEEIGSDTGHGRIPIEKQRVFVPDGHVVVLAHFEFDEPFGGVVLDDVGLVGMGVLSAKAERLERLAMP